MNITESLLESLTVIAQEAGRAIMEVYEETIVVYEKSDQSPVTVADMRADAIIRNGLEKAFPGIFILSEESVSSNPVASDGKELLFLVDPLDGTKEFLKRNGEFTVNIALICQGKAIAGVVHAPALSETYIAGESIGAWKVSASGRQPLRVAQSSDVSELRIIASRSHPCERLSTWLRKLRQPYKLVEAGSSLKFCRVAEGLADLYPRFVPTSQWDTAAAHCIVEIAGGVVLDVNGHPLSYGLCSPIINPSFIAMGKGNITQMLLSASEC